jgi:hypothetical protein
MKDKVIHIPERGCHNCRLHYIDHKKCASEYPCKQGMEWKPIVDTEKCKECGGRTALIHGSFYYEPDSEPYMNGVTEEAKVIEGECWVGGYKCDDCGNIQGLWHE